MAITFKEAVKKMSGDPNLKYYFFFCEKGKDNKPELLVDTKKLDPKKEGPAKDALGLAKEKGNSIGTMRLRDKVLSLKPQGSGLAAKKLETGVQHAVRYAQVGALIDGVAVAEPEAEEGEKKEFADPLRADPAIAKLLDQRAEIQGKVKATLGTDSAEAAIKDTVKRKALQLLQVELKGVEEKLEEAQKRLNTKGFKTQALRPEYKDEDKKYGWRTDILTQKKREEFASDEEYETYLSNLEKLRESDLRVTQRFTKQEMHDSEVHFDDQGRAIGKTQKNPDGTVSGPTDVLGSTNVGFVMDESGTMHQFNSVGLIKTGISMENPVTGETVQKEILTHHSSVLDGQAVVGAGEVKIDINGYLTMISNKSGHYKPGATQMIQLLEELARQGALLDKDYRMPGPDGKGIPLEGKPKQIYDAVAKVEYGIQKKLSEGKDIRPDLAAIDQAKQVLAKLGVAPANQFADVTVEFLDGAENKTGAQIRMATATKSTAEDFLMSGGGNQEQSTKKKVMLDALKKKLADKAAKLDEEAAKLAESVSEKMKEKVKELQINLQWYREQYEKSLENNNNSEENKALQQKLFNGIMRIEAVLIKLTGVSDEALDKALKELQNYYDADIKLVEVATRGKSGTDTQKQVTSSYDPVKGNDPPNETGEAPRYGDSPELPGEETVTETGEAPPYGNEAKL